MAVRLGVLDGCTDREEQKNEEKGRQGERKIRGTEQVAREVNDWRDDGGGCSGDGEAGRRFSE